MPPRLELLGAFPMEADGHRVVGEDALEVVGAAIEGREHLIRRFLKPLFGERQTRSMISVTLEPRSCASSPGRKRRSTTREGSATSSSSLVCTSGRSRRVADPGRSPPVRHRPPPVASYAPRSRINTASLAPNLDGVLAGECSSVVDKRARIAELTEFDGRTRDAANRCHDPRHRVRLQTWHLTGNKSAANWRCTKALAEWKDSRTRSSCGESWLVGDPSCSVTSS